MSDDSERRPLLSDQPSGSHDTFGRGRRPAGLERSQSHSHSHAAPGAGASGKDGDDEGEHGESWRAWMGERLESPRTHKLVLVLVCTS